MPIEPFTGFTIYRVTYEPSDPAFDFTPKAKLEPVAWFLNEHHADQFEKELGGRLQRRKGTPRSVAVKSLCCRRDEARKLFA